MSIFFILVFRQLKISVNLIQLKCHFRYFGGEKDGNENTLDNLSFLDTPAKKNATPKVIHINYSQPVSVE